MRPRLEANRSPYSLPTMRRNLLLPTISQKASVEYQLEVVENGRVVYTHPKKRNLILNIGLDQVASNSWIANLGFISVGSNTVPVKRDSGTTTFSRSGTTVTASSAFFDPTDDDNGGRLLKFDSGEEMTVVTYTDSTHVIVNLSGTIAASQGTLWYVNETVNTGEFMRFSNVEAQNETFSVDTLTHTVRMISGAAVAANVGREIGWSSIVTANGNLFGRDLIAGGGVSIAIGQQYRVTVSLSITYSPTAPVSYPDVGNNGFNTAGQSCFGPILNDVQAWNNAFGSVRSLDPSIAPPLGAILTSFSLPNLSYTAGSSGATIPNTVGSSPVGSYASGSYLRDFIAGFGVGSANGTIYGFCLGDNNSGFAGANNAWNYLFTTPQTKDNLHNLFFTIRKSWGRILIN